MSKIDVLNQWDREYFLHPYTHLAQHARGEAPNRIMTEGSGCYVKDADGREYLDAFAGLYCVNVGYGRQEIYEAVIEQARKLSYFHAYFGNSTEASITLSKMIIDRAPQNMSRVYFGLGGSDANDTNIKFIWYYNNLVGRTEKKKIIARWRAYHGSGIVSGSCTGLKSYHRMFDLPVAQIIHTEAPYYYRREHLEQSEEEFSQYCAYKLEELIQREGSDTVAGFIGEPALGTGGLAPPPKGYWPAIQAVLKKYDVFLISDEVVTGFGRLGSMFGAQHYGMQPDFMTIAKGLTSAYAPLSGSVVSEKVWQVLAQGSDELGPISHGWTYSGHPLGAAAGIANLELLDKLKLVENTVTVGKYFKQNLEEALGNHQHVGEIRGDGLLVAVDFVADKEHRIFFDLEHKVAPRINAALLEEGVIARAMPEGDIIGFAPPLCLSKAEADIIVDKFAKAVVKVSF